MCCLYLQAVRDPAGPDSRSAPGAMPAPSVGGQAQSQGGATALGWVIPLQLRSVWDASLASVDAFICLVNKPQSTNLLIVQLLLFCCLCILALFIHCYFSWTVLLFFSQSVLIFINTCLYKFPRCPSGRRRKPGFLLQYRNERATVWGKQRGLPGSRAGLFCRRVNAWQNL